MAFLYDIFWVFYSHYFFGQSVMATVATSIDLPMKFQCPAFFVDETSPLSKCSLIGLGDIILPGILVKYLRKCDEKMIKKHLFLSGMVAYVLGISACMICLLVFNTA